MRLLAIIIALACAGPASANEYALVRARALYDQLRDRGQCEASLPAARDFWRSGDFGTLTVPVRSALLYEMAQCAWTLEDGRAAAAIGRDAYGLGAQWSPYMLMQIGLRFDDDALAIEFFHVMAERDRQTLAAMPWRFAWGALRAARAVDATGGEALRIHDVLAALPYAPREGGNDDALRMEHARLLLDRGQAAQARQRVSTITAPRQVMMMRIDRRFDALRDDSAFAERLDVRRMAEADLARAEVDAAAQPRKLQGFLDVAQAMRALGRLDDALALLDLYIGRAQQPHSAYEDVNDSLHWLLNERAYILYDLGRLDDARAAFGLAIAQGEDGEWNVSQVINFASMLVAEGRPRDALEVVRTVGQASPYGDMWIANVRACAAEQVGDRAVQDEAMAFLRENAEDNIAALARALLCVNDLDGAAALYIERLADLEKRGAALIALQRYLPPPNLLPHDALLRERLETVRMRPDVQAAIDAVGRIEDVPLHSVYWGDI